MSDWCLLLAQQLLAGVCCLRIPVDWCAVVPEAGDSLAAETLQQLAGEADTKRKEMIEQLQCLAYQGDARAVQMLEQLNAGTL